MKLDVVKEIKIENSLVSGWTRGTISDIKLKNENKI